jgi:DNA-binding HxlR family transcriptional regulator
MRKKRNDPKWVDDPGVAERAIVLQVLRDDHHERWTRMELKREIYDIKGRTINRALKRLQEEGVVDLDEEYVWPTRCAQYLDELGMVSI